jgi:hypothetical protein
MTTDTFNPGDPPSWPVWMRETRICSEGGRVGPFPASRFQWRKLAPPPVKFGSRISCWHRNTVAAICQLPLPDPEPAQLAATTRTAPSAAPGQPRTSKRRTPRTSGLAKAS